MNGIHLNGDAWLILALTLTVLAFMAIDKKGRKK